MMIFYTGIGAKKSGRHTPAEFMKIVRAHMHKDVLLNLRKKNGKYQWFPASPATVRARILKFRKYTPADWAKEYGAIVMK
jgi:hypothetical protein